jgi:hypothetical protein
LSGNKSTRQDLEGSSSPANGDPVTLFNAGPGFDSNAFIIEGNYETAGGVEGVVIQDTTNGVSYFLTNEEVLNNSSVTSLTQLSSPVELATTSESGFNIYGLTETQGNTLDVVNTPGDQPTSGATLTTQGSGTLNSGDTFTVSNVTDTLDGSYTYEGTATVDGAAGFIGKNAAGQNFFFTTSSVTITNGDQVNGSQSSSDICFMPGTMIRTPTGEVAVEALKIGDLVETVDGRSIPVRWIGRQTVSRHFGGDLRLPICLKANALSDTVPCRDLLVSPDHALFVDGILIQASALVNGTSIVRFRDAPMTFTYYHLELQDHSLILAENTPAETFIDNVDRAGFDNWDEYEALYPADHSMIESPYPRAKAFRQVPRAIRERLVERGAALYGTRVSTAA